MRRTQFGSNQHDVVGQTSGGRQIAQPHLSICIKAQRDTGCGNAGKLFNHLLTARPAAHAQHNFIRAWTAGNQIPPAKRIYSVRADNELEHVCSVVSGHVFTSWFQIGLVIVIAQCCEEGFDKAIVVGDRLYIDPEITVQPARIKLKRIMACTASDDIAVIHLLDQTLAAAGLQLVLFQRPSS